jgi:adenosylcobyric acid synthase
VVGFVINKFRGDLALLQSGLDWLEDRTGKPVLGVLFYLRGLYLGAEDALPRDHVTDNDTGFRVVVPALPHISNHTDFDPLRMNDQIDFHFAAPGDAPIGTDLIILPGSKSVRDDLDWIRTSGWDTAIERHLRYGRKVIGICGGLQMLGTSIADPSGIEGPPGTADGLGLLDLTTALGTGKRLENLSVHLSLGDEPVTGYEIHSSNSRGPALARPAAHVNGAADGTISDDDQILATYLHGVFESAQAANALLRWAGMKEPKSADPRSRARWPRGCC